jgi:hypothetical protein
MLMGENGRLINVVQVDQDERSRGELVRVKLKLGDMEVEVESPPDRISDVVARIVEGISHAGPPRAERPAAAPAARAGGTTCRGLIESLWREGWFSEPRILSDVAAELSRRGYNYDSTAISHALADLVRAGTLSRMGTPRTYKYVQKRPPSD